MWQVRWVLKPIVFLACLIPALHLALDRIKVYRHNSMHIELNAQVGAKFSEYLREDLDGRHPREFPDLWFQLQQRILDRLFGGIQVETAKSS